ncbi:MAG: HlyD family secretion protein [Bacteroidetes bacterium]|nr:MAG: HlyD family secretion protein [Bacteroidota bacterium]
MKEILIAGIVGLMALSCKRNDEVSDAYGNFEAEEVLVSAQTSGTVSWFGPREGTRLGTGEPVLLIDTVQLALKKQQLQSGKASIRARLNTLDAQLAAQRVQQANLEREVERLEHLVEGDAATSKQLDDLKGQLAYLEAQIQSLASQKLTVYAEAETLDIQIAQVDDQISRSLVKSPLDGVLLSRFRLQGEIVAAGQPLFKVASLDTLVLRAYISGKQLQMFSEGQKVRVLIDGVGGMDELSGTVEWISAQAEFTPKTIQTREERVSLVYALKVSVKNDGALRIGMPGEVRLKD